MEEPQRKPAVIASINNELQRHYQRMVNAYRPDLKEDLPPRKPIFHPLNPCHLKEQQEIDRREIRVTELLTTQLQEEETELPQRLLLLGRPESGKTALFALILHYWLHNKERMLGLREFDILLAVQCLGLVPPSSDREKAVDLDLEKHMLEHIPNSIKQHGEEMVRQVMRRAKVFIIIDSLDCLDNKTPLDEKTSLAPWSDYRMLLFCRYKFMKDNPAHVFFSEQSKDNLVLKLWGGVAPNLFECPATSPEDISELGGVFSDKLLQDYCKRLCTCKKKQMSSFWEYYRTKLKYLSADMRKPFNIYMAMEAYCNNHDFDVETQSQLYSKWLEIWSTSYMTNFCKSESDPSDLTGEGIRTLKKLAHTAFNSDKEYMSQKEFEKHQELMVFLTHFLLPHYNPQGKVQHFTFRIAAHRFFLAAKQMVAEIEIGKDMKDVICTEEFKKLQHVLPMILGVAQGNHQEKLKKHCIIIARLNWEDHYSRQFKDRIINYAVSILSETEHFSKKDYQSDPLVEEIVGYLPKENWCIVDGNIHPEGLKVLCEGGKIMESCKKPEKLNILLASSPTDMPGLREVLEAVQEYDIRINLCSDRSFLNEAGEFPLDDAVLGFHSNGKASLGSITAHLKMIKKLDASPATRRVYKVGLRICSNDEYDQLRKMCKSSHKLKQVMLRISSKADIMPKKLKELPSSISSLTVYLESFEFVNVEKAINIWSAIQGKAKRKVQKLRFWDNPEKRLSLECVKKIIKANLSGTSIEVPLEQPVSQYDKDILQKELNKLPENIYIIKLLGSHQYPKEDMRKK